MKNLLEKYKVYLLLGALMLAEAGILIWWMPSDHQPPNLAHAGTEEMPVATIDPDKIKEMEIGVFKIENVADQARPLRVDFTVFATIDEDDSTVFEEDFKKRENRIKEAVATVVRKAPYDDLHDPSLNTIRRQVKQAVIGILGRDKQYIGTIIIPDFKTFEL